MNFNVKLEVSQHFINIENEILRP